MRVLVLIAALLSGCGVANYSPELVTSDDPLLVRARDRADEIGIADADLLYDPFFVVPGEPSSPWTDSGGGGALSYGGASGVLRLSVTSPGIYARVNIGPADRTRAVLPDPHTSPLYFAVRFRTEAVLSGGALVGVGAVSASTSVIAGVLSAYEATYGLYVASALGLYDADTAVGQDTAWHVAEVWSVGDGVLHFVLDGGAESSISATGITTTTPALVVSRGTMTTAAALVDAVVYAVPPAGG